MLITFVTSLFAIDEQGLSTHNGFQVTSVENGKKIQYSNPGFELKQFNQNGKNYIKPEMLNAGATVEPGQPYLPTISTFYAVEPGKTFSVSATILESETMSNVEVFPLEGWEPDLTGNATEGNIYTKNQNFPENIAIVSEPIIIRGLVLVQVSITPFQYNPISKELTVIQSADIELIQNGNTELPFIPARRSRAFESIYKTLVVNYESLNRNNIPYQRPSILYVLPNNIGNLMNTIEPLMEWKERVGYEVNYISSSNVVNNSNNLKNYIEDAYENWDNPPTHVTIVGDASGSYDIPTWNESWSGYNGDGDHPYSLLEGNDQFPEVFLGRISFSTSSHLQTIVSKTLNYESTPYMNENWFQRACLVGDQSSSGISCIITNENIHEMMDLVGFEDVNTVYSGSFPSQMTSGISEGVSFFNYRGYYGVSGFGSSNVNSTSNGFMLPVATVITCGTGSFGSGESLSESFIRAGTSSVPKGAVVCVGTATTGTHTMFNNVVDMGFYYGAFIDNIETAGAALMYGKMELFKTYPSNPSNYCSIFSHWNTLMGESSLAMWTDYPEMVTVDHPYAITTGTNYIDITVSKGVGNVEDAWVTILMNGEIFESGYTNEQGFIRLPITSTETGNVMVTVTKKNHYPYLNSFQIYDPGVSINLSETTIVIDDDVSGQSNGNSNGIANGGETLELYIGATNYGSEDAVNVSAVLSGGEGLVSFQNATVNFGDIFSGETIGSSSPFILTLDSGIHDGTHLNLTATFIDDTGNSFAGALNINVSGNNLLATDIDVIGSINDVLSPGQISNFKIELDNSGTTNAIQVTGTITCASPFVEIVDNSGTWTSVMNGSSSFNNNDYFQVSTLEETIPGAIVHFILNVVSSDGYESNSIIEVQIGEPDVYDPVGPDSYGYYIYDSGDIGYILSPTYNWVEIDDREGGAGTYLSSLSDNGNNQDDVETINLPFDFSFYGQNYNQISICSNGWIAMGDTDMESFRNYQIPGMGGPGAMIAVFWDDLKFTNGGRVYTWYDDIEKKFYIEWSRVRTYQNNSLETFQAVLLDPSYYLTPTGDGEILLQYKEFNNTSYTSGAQNHGNYCTVGTEDHTMTEGVQYTYNNEYHQAALPLSDETALLITTRGSDIRLHGDMNYDEVIDIYDLQLLVDYNLGYTGQVNEYFGDINGDGMVNVMDLIALIRIIMQYNL
jgi:hypothetical protein